MMGIYKITNIINNKVYIGQSINLQRRKTDHIRDLNKNRNHNNHFQNAWNKYGEENFIFEIIHVVDDSDELNKLETYYIDLYDSTNPDKGYNYTRGGDNPSVSELYRQEMKVKLRGINSKLSFEDVRHIKLLMFCLMDRKEISKLFNVSVKSLTQISIGKSFDYVSPELNDKIHNLKQCLIDERNEYILELFDSGLGITDICNKTGYTASIVEKCVYKYRDAIGTRKRKYQHIYDEVHRLYEEGYNKYTISKMLKISPSTVNRYLTNFSNPYNELNYKKVTKDIENEIINLYFNEDKTIKYIADIFSLSENTVRDYVNRYKHANTEVS